MTQKGPAEATTPTQGSIVHILKVKGSRAVANSQKELGRWQPMLSSCLSVLGVFGSIFQMAW